MRKAVFTLNVNDYEPDIRALTYPLLQRYANRIGADFIVISERRFPDFPAVYEKLQIHELGRPYDWNVFFDSDALVHPDLFDITDLLSKDTVLQNSKDFAPNRFTYDEYFRRDGRHIGACNWFTVASNWCLDLWRPLDDLTLQEAVARIQPIAYEQQRKIDASHLIDDYVLSRNIARFGLKHKTFESLLGDIGRPTHEYFWHDYTIPASEKLARITQIIQNWRL
jgi:hypothetical protein